MAAEMGTANERKSDNGKKKKSSSVRKVRALSARQQRFVSEYLIDLNEVQAVCRAGYAKRAAAPTAMRLLAMPEVREAIQAKRKEKEDRMQVTQEAVIRELAAVGFANLKDVCTWDDGHLTLMSSHELSDMQAASIAEISETVTTRGGTVRVKQYSKLKALEMLAKHVGLYDSPEIEQGEKKLEDLSPVLKQRLETIYGICVDEGKNQNLEEGGG